MPYCKHHKYKGAHLYVCVYELSDCSDNRMTYYTHYKYKGAHHYVCVHAFSAYSCH
jgi:hypothetical protein